MKALFKIILSLYLCLIVNNIYGQEIVEVKKPEISKEYLETLNKIIMDPSSFLEVLKINSSMVDKNIKPFEECLRYGMSIYLNGFNKDYEKALNIWDEALEKQCFFQFTLGDNPDPPFLKGIEDQKRLKELYQKNEQLLQAAQVKARVEYYVNTPTNYLKEIKYPLIIVIHGGQGSHWASELAWSSAKINNEYIAAYIQGSIVQSSSVRSFNEETGLKNIQSVYEQIIKNYSIDTSRIVIAGFSAGGKRSVLLTLDKMIPAKGLILANPVRPTELEAGKVIDMAIRGVRVNIISGENDSFLVGQKEMGVIFDKLGVANRFVIFPKIGHTYPPDFSDQIDLSLEFIFKIEEV